MKKAAFLMAAAMVGLAGCGSAGNDVQTVGAAQESQVESKTTSERTEESEKDASGSITLYTSQPEEDAQKLIDGFNQ